MRRPTARTGKINAIDYNRLIDGAERSNRSQLGTPDPPIQIYRSSDVVHVRNDSGAARIAGEVLQIDGHIAGDEINRHSLTFSGITPTGPGTSIANSNPCGILLAPVPDERFGYLQLSGVCMARVSIGDASHKFAFFHSSNLMQSSDYGQARILARDGEGTGNVNAAVMLSTLPTYRPLIRFELSESLTTTAQTAGAKIVGWTTGTTANGLQDGETGVGTRSPYVGGGASSISVINMQTGVGTFLFSGATGAFGFGLWTGAGNQYVILQMECP